MTPARYIREHIFAVRTQHEFAAMLGYSQAHISRLETGIELISRAAQEKIRALAQAQGLQWNDSWFFDVPTNQAEKPSSAIAA